MHVLTWTARGDDGKTQVLAPIIQKIYPIAFRPYYSQTCSGIICPNLVLGMCQLLHVLFNIQSAYCILWTVPVYILRHVLEKKILHLFNWVTSKVCCLDTNSSTQVVAAGCIVIAQCNPYRHHSEVCCVVFILTSCWNTGYFLCHLYSYTFEKPLWVILQQIAVFLTICMSSARWLQNVVWGVFYIVHLFSLQSMPTFIL